MRLKLASPSFSYAHIARNNNSNFLSIDNISLLLYTNIFKFFQLLKF
nr:MAG TPA: hypothetical protein [Bacteriophage sp.]